MVLVCVTQLFSETNIYLAFSNNIAVHKSVIAFIMTSDQLIRLQLKY